MYREDGWERFENSPDFTEEELARERDLDTRVSTRITV